MSKQTRKSTDLSSATSILHKVSLSIPILDPPGFIEELQQKQSFHNRPNLLEIQCNDDRHDGENKDPNIGDEILIERFYDSKNTISGRTLLLQLNYQLNLIANIEFEEKQIPRTLK